LFNIRDRSVAQRYIIRGYDILVNVKRDCPLSITRGFDVRRLFHIADGLLCT
jgi:hypothetical protein